MEVSFNSSFGGLFFNFNEKKVETFIKNISCNNETIQKLQKCTSRHHSNENCVLMPVTGGSNRVKGKIYYKDSGFVVPGIGRPTDVVIDKLTYKNNKNTFSKNTEGKGIPQGSPISTVLSNVYMVELDQMINDYVNVINGMYIRYSDDFIVVIPNKFNDYQLIHKILSYISEVPNLVLKRQKTQIFSVKNNIVTNIGIDVLDEANSYKNTIDFLGFSFDDGHVRMRSKTVGKYYYRMYRRAKTVVRNQGRGMKKLYSKYSYKGANETQNFFTYVNNAVKIYGKNELIGIDFKHHMQKIRKGLKKSSTCR